MERQYANAPLFRYGFMAHQPATDAGAKSSSALLSFAPGPTRVICSSTALSWRGLVLEKHSTSPGERASASIDCCVISMLTVTPSRFEHRTAFGPFVECVSRPGTIMITPAGEIPEIRLHTPSDFIHCALEKEFTSRVAAELGRRGPCQPIFQPGIQDKTIRRILCLLAEELVTERPLGRLFVESLAHALAVRYLLLDCAPTNRSDSRVSRLPSRILNRVREKIESNLEADLSLDALAAESGYSQAHFLRMFRAATGLTPHQYVLDLRLRRAQDCLRQKNSSIIDVAMSCGFASQSHMTTAFRQHLEMTPAEFRRSANACVEQAQQRT